MFRGEAEGEPVTGSQVEADVVAEVVKDVIPGFNIFLLDWKKYIAVCLKYCVNLFLNNVSGVTAGDKTAVDSILPIVQSQRERYRLRAQELEAVRFTFLF